jgi:pimeloyl-ACP methyl ester carboxylesterase
MPTAHAPDGAEIFYETRGTGPINLAMVHGWGGVGGLWYQVARHLNGLQFTSWLIDLRGHGRSPVPASGFDLDNFASDVLAVADENGAEQFIPIGASMGGKLTLYLTAKNVARVPAHIMVESVGPGPSPISDEERREMVRRARNWTELKAHIRNWFGPSVAESTIDSCCRAVSRTPASILEVTAAKILAAPLPEPFNRSDTPTLVVIGELDPNYGPDYQRDNVLPFLGRAESVTLPVGHFATLEEPAELARLISDFARAHWTPPEPGDNLRP